MPVGAVILVEPSHPGNLGAAIRVAANFGVARLELVCPAVLPDDPEVVRWACGGERRVRISCHGSFEDASAGLTTLAASASGRGRPGQPAVGPNEAAAELARRGLDGSGLVFGNETRGLTRHDLDRCDLVVRIPAVPEFPVLNLAQAVAVVLGTIAAHLRPAPATAPVPAGHEQVAALMEHLRSSLLAIGFLDPASPDRILRKLRRLLGRAAVTDNEIAILRGVCRQIDWAARNRPGLDDPPDRRRP